MATVIPSTTGTSLGGITFYGRDEDGPIQVPPNAATFGKSFWLERAIEEDGFLEYTLHMK